MPGKPLVQFEDFVAMTGPLYLTGPDQILNEQMLQNYGFFSPAMSGRDVAEAVRGGSSVKETLQVDAPDDNEGFYLPGQPMNFQIVDTSQTLTYNWRFYRKSWGWVDQEVMLNEGEERFDQYKRIKKAKEQDCWRRIINGMETSFISAPPNYAEMETNTGKQTHCLRALITEAGAAPTTADGTATTGGDTTAWATGGVIGGVDCTLTRFKNQVFPYTSGAASTTLLKAFRDSFRRLKFKAPRAPVDYFKDSSFAKTRYITTADGQETYQKILYESNDNTKNDAGTNTTNPQFSGLPVEWVPELETVATAMSWSAGAPRFYCINHEYLKPVYHRARYLEQMKPISLAATGALESWAVPNLSWYTMVCTSRFRQGIIVPA